LCSGTTAEKPLSGSTGTREVERDGDPPTHGPNDEPATSPARCITGCGEFIAGQTAEGQRWDGAKASEDGLPATGDGRLGSSSRKGPSIDIEVERGELAEVSPPGSEELGGLAASGYRPPTGHETPYIDTRRSHIAGATCGVDTAKLKGRESRSSQAEGEIRVSLSEGGCQICGCT
jgi:hypothetical protein